MWFANGYQRGWRWVLTYRLGERRYAQIRPQFTRPMSRSDVALRTFEQRPFSPDGWGWGRVGCQSSWLQPPMGQAQRGVCHLLLRHRILCVSLLLGAALTKCLFVSVDNRLWWRFPISCGRCDWVLLIFSGDQTLRCLRPRKHMVPTTTLDGGSPTHAI